MPSKERRLIGGRDFQALIEQAREQLNEITHSLRKLQEPTLPGRFRPIFGNRGEQAINDLHTILVELEKIGRRYKKIRLIAVHDQPCGEGEGDKK